MNKLQKKRIRYAALLFLTLLCLIGTGTGVFAQDHKKVRIGYMDYDGFIVSNPDGSYQGYGVAYLNKLAQYTGWEYEYTFSTWKDLLEQLKDGKIDFLCTAQYTPERARVYRYSDYAIGQEASVIYARQGDDSIFYEDYPAMDGKRIGMLEESFQNGMLKQYEEKHGISMEASYFSTDRELIHALDNGTVDLVLLGGLSLHTELKVVAQFHPTPFYIITGLQNEALIGELNEAQENINTFFPNFQNQLFEQYYGASAASNEPLLTREEADYIKHSDPVLVGCIGGLVPLCYRDQKTGEADGMLPAMIHILGERSGLKLKCVLLENETNAMEDLKNSQIDLLVGIPNEPYMWTDSSVWISEPLLKENLIMIARPGRKPRPDGSLKIAMPHQYSFLTQSLSSFFSPYSIQYYNTVEECIDSLIAGENDITLQNNYVANYYLQRKRYQHLIATSIPDIYDSMPIVGNEKTDKRLLSIIDKTLSCLSTQERAGILTAYSIGKPYEDSFPDMLWYYRYTLFAVIILGSLLIAVAMALHKRKIKMRLAQKDADTYRQISQMDALTGIYNRYSFYDHARVVLDENTDIIYQFIYLNIENFKLVNDLFGTDEGDRLLRLIASWCEEYAVEHNGVAGRLDSDHFVLCVPTQEEQGEYVVNLLKSHIKERPFDMDITINCGVYEAQERSKKVQLMCDRAHLASNDSKGNVLKPVTYYSDEHREHLIQTQQIVNEMQTALSEGQFQIYLQPQIDMTAGKLVGAEALVRWVHPVKGILFPGQFIPVFEQNGFIAKLDLYVFEEVCRLQKKWKDEGKELFPISVNLSRVNFFRRRLRDQLLRIISQYELEPKYVELELTESAYADDSHEIYNRLTQLQADGFAILMDDFGSGYSALNMLKDAPVDVLKLDLRFLYKTDPYQRSWQILKSIISMAQELNIPVIAEGVETKEQIDILSNTSCRVAQGYYYSRPVSVPQFELKYQM